MTTKAGSKPAMSAFDNDHSIDYGKYEAKLDIVRKR